MIIAAYENNTTRLKQLNIQKIEHSVAVDMITIHEVVNDQLHARTCAVDENNYTQCDCTYFQQFGTLCPHIIKSYSYLKHLSKVSAMTSQKWSDNVVPIYMKVDVKHEEKTTTSISV